MQTITASDIREDVRVRLNLPTLGSTGVITTTIINTFVRESAEALAGKVREGFGDMFFTEHYQAQVEANANTIDLQSYNASSVLKVAWTRDNDRFEPIPRATHKEVYGAGITPKSWLTHSPTYRLRGRYLELYPTPSQDMLVMLTVTTGFNIASDLSTQIDVWPGWREWIVLDVCRKVLRRENKLDEMRTVIAERDDVWENIASRAINRDDYGTVVIGDERADWELGPFDGRRWYPHG